MVALNRISPYTDYPTASLSEDLLAEVVDLRAHGKSWDDVAFVVGWDLKDLRRAVRHDPHFEAALKLARREADQEAEADGLARLRKLAQDDSTDIAFRAIEIITKYLSEKRRDETRLAVERQRAKGRMARAEAMQAKAASVAPAAKTEEKPGAPPAQPSPMKSLHTDLERRHAEYLARDKAVVFLWGGCHALDNVPPDETDTPLLLMVDSTVRGRTIYWVLAEPFVTNPVVGPFLKPPGCRPATCPPLATVAESPSGEPQSREKQSE